MPHEAWGNTGLKLTLPTSRLFGSLRMCMWAASGSTWVPTFHVAQLPSMDPRPETSCEKYLFASLLCADPLPGKLSAAEGLPDPSITGGTFSGGRLAGTCNGWPDTQGVKSAQLSAGLPSAAFLCMLWSFWVGDIPPSKEYLQDNLMKTKLQSCKRFLLKGICARASFDGIQPGCREVQRGHQFELPSGMTLIPSHLQNKL